MRDLLLSFLIGGTVVVGATEMIGITDVLHGRDPSAAVRSAVPELPELPSMPSLPDSFIPGSARSIFSGSDSTATPTADPQAADSHPMYIARTGGTGVRTRAACLDEAPGQSVAAEGSAVSVLRQGGRECPGWAFVSNGKSQFWVRMTYLDASAPKASAVTSGGAVPPAAPKPEPAPGSDKDDTEKKAESKDEEKRKEEEKPTPTPVATAASTPSATPTAEPTPRRPSPTPKATPTEEPQEDES